MTYFGKGKRLIIIAISLMGLLLFSIIAIFATHNPESQTSNPESAFEFKSDGSNGYIFDGKNKGETGTESDGAINKEGSDTYNKFNHYYITNAEGLMAFSASVGWGWAFQKKIVYLLNDIDMTGFDFDPIGAVVSWEDGKKKYHGAHIFGGVFDARSHTVKTITSNFDIIQLDKTKHVVKEFKYPCSAGFFALAQDAVIWNLRIQDFTINWNSSPYDGETSYIYDPHSFGAIAGYQIYSGYYYNCIVEDFEVVLTHPGSNPVATVSGIVGSAYSSANSNQYLMIYNCYVNGVKGTLNSTNEGKDTFHRPAALSVAGLYGNIKVSEELPKLKFENEGTFGTITTGNSLVGGLEANVTIADEGRFDKYTVTDNYGFPADTLTGDVYEITESSGLNPDWGTRLVNPIGTQSWYIPPTTVYNNGYPYLRGFAKPKTYTFKAGNNGSVTVNGSTTTNTIEVPTTTTFTAPSGENTSFCGVPITATPNEGYCFDKWTLDENTYTANFKKIQYNVTFKFINEAGTSLAGNKSYTLNYGTWCSITFYSDVGDVGADLTKVGYLYIAGVPEDDAMVKIKNSNMYQYKGYIIKVNGVVKMSGDYVVFGLKNLGANDTEVEITLVFKLKEYGVELG